LLGFSNFFSLRLFSLGFFAFLFGGFLSFSRLLRLDGFRFLRFLGLIFFFLLFFLLFFLN
jgi:hypothetical protein